MEEEKLKHELVKRKMEEKLSRIKDEILKLKEREAKISTQLFDELEQKQMKIWKNLDRVDDELKEIEKRISKEEEKIKGEEVFFKRLNNELLKDKLIDDEDDFEFKLTPAALFIDGKKQPEKYFLKYKKIIEHHRGKKLEKGRKFQIINRK